jgi:hypothetical protein
MIPADGGRPEHAAEKWKPLFGKQYAQLIGIDHVVCFLTVRQKAA